MILLKASEVLKLLRITRQTLSKYVKEKVIAVNELPNGRYEYDDKSVYAFLNKGESRKTYIYARVSCKSQSSDLECQITDLKQYCSANGYVVSGVYTDIANGVDFEKRKGFYQMLDDIMENKVERIVIAHKDRLARTGYELINHIAEKHNCKILTLCDFGSNRLDGQDIYEETKIYLHSYTAYPHTKKIVNSIRKAINGSDNVKG